MKYSIATLILFVLSGCNDGGSGGGTPTNGGDPNTQNIAPSANAGPPQAVVVGATVKLDGSKSSDVNGDGLTYSWALTSSPSGSTARLSSSSLVSPTFVADMAGTYVIALTVNDGKSNSQTTATTVSTEQVNLGSLGLVGMWQNVESTPSDIIFIGDRASKITSVSLAGNACPIDRSKSTTGFAIFTCTTPSVTSGDQRFDYLRVSSSDQTDSWNAGPIYTSSKTFWRQHNGELYIQSLAKYIFTGASTVGAVVSIVPQALSGNYADINFPNYYSAIRLNSTICPKIAGLDWKYQCPVVPSGSYVVELLSDNNTRILAGQAFLVNISTSGTPDSSQSINGMCGAADQHTVNSIPTTASDLCTSGTASAVSGSGPWLWTCAGLGVGATTASCSANYSAPLPRV